MIKAKKHFGQNFLQDKATLDKIIQAIPNDVENVVEIGPGLGDLTFRLLQIYKTTCFEIDCELFQILKAKFANEIQNGQLKLFCKDALEQWQEEGGLSSQNYFLVANLPYYVATKMIINAIDDEKCLGLIVMIQKEVALKFSAKSRDKEFSALSILASLQGRCELLFDVDAKLFNPPPKVTSSVIKLQKTKKIFGKDGIFKDAKQYEAFKVFLRAAFASPRKTLLKNLSTNFDKKVLEEIFEDLGLAQNLRPHELDVDSYLKVFERLKEDNERQKRRESCN
ncbi:16S rRNA (adenine(1518)-N(6)/adenine(1519)-N(6))-dimethyltransferase RsmA [Campylobacter concisus]|uniref:16S rRNA (adenine(1518)-N(6)/adenine(1519)-N(6))- dimethyltransferase RsmA n=1 Tax=Campylobacter concisus TaxID=199 RepID=UPI000CD8030E|nr:16S rRNA (adenine(1518)-N(6)/adenine(1519)-N(6))-dimethyltransferase RsmA [Campylobacter concisus]